MPTNHTAPRRRTRPRMRTVLVAVALGCAAIGGYLTFLAVQDSGPGPVVVNDVSGRPSACLVSSDSSQAVTDTAGQAWAAMSRGAAGKRVNIEQLHLNAPDARAAKPLLAGLVNQHCTLIVTVGQSYAEAARTYPEAHRTTTFLTLDANAGGVEQAVAALAAHT